MFAYNQDVRDQNLKLFSSIIHRWYITPLGCTWNDRPHALFQSKCKLVDSCGPG